MTQILAYIKPTNYCNVGCEHCYLPLSVRQNKEQMSLDTFHNTMELLVKLAIRRNADHILVLYHGGEPMMMAPSKMFEYSDIVKAYSMQYGIAITESIQTSLIPFSKSWVPFIKERLGSHIGSSVDFHTRTIRGKSESYLSVWLKRVDLARKSGITVTPGMVVTLNECGKEDEIVDWFLDNGFSHFNLERYNTYGQKLPDWPSNLEHSEFLISLFDNLLNRIKNGEPFITNNVITAGIRGVLHGVPGDRWGGSCMSDFVVIEPNGGTNNCPDKTSFERSFSNVSSGIEEFTNSKERRGSIRIQRIDHKMSHCSSCEFNSWCKSGCPITPNGPDNGQSECSGYKKFLLHIKNYLENNIDGLKTINKYLKL
ncbi:radical SAM/SPASM domain-containing protein [Photobacterium leiognathi]|uniref:radical SAM/SPASM domain-containing protein n=1 Tax=Photobacterium leiognathi TaxID=553611 RepID=UPI0029813BC6|nr:SPASM domain-containing protein [Photobacterium leiognathi]